jgi:hypothetical protein
VQNPTAHAALLPELTVKVARESERITMFVRGIQIVAAALFKQWPDSAARRDRVSSLRLHLRRRPSDDAPAKICK